MKLFAPCIGDLCAKRIDGKSGLGTLLASHLKALSEVLPSIDDKESSNIAIATLDLIGAAAKPSDARQYRSTIHRTLLHQIQSHIINNLNDPKLSPTSIASAFRISRRYLHRLFEQSDTSVCDWILGRRLDACKRALEDPALAHLSITEIAFSWGFNSASYFSRAFRLKYDVSPSKSRQIAGQRQN